MKAIHCPNCHRLLPEDSQYCVVCGEFFASADTELQDARAGQSFSTSTAGGRKTRPLTEQNTLRSPWIGRRITSSLLDEEYEEGDLDLEVEQRHETWQKVVETPARPPAVHPPRPPLPPQSHSILKHMPYGHSRLSPVLLFWCSMVVLFFFVGGGIFGIVGTMGRGRATSPVDSTLQITPGDVAIGATMNLHGTGFSPRAQIGLTRDAAIPIVDTNETTIIMAKADGSFNDTVIVGPDWVAGTHTISAEDSVTHKFTSSPIEVTGMGDLLRPAHLNLSVASLDLGSGDQAINSVKKVALTNLGGGQISWKAAAGQPWLTISPQGGTFSSGMKAEVEIAVDRTDLQPGSFSDEVLFSSSAGDSTLPIKMSVVPLPLQPTAVLQVSPPALSFTGSDGSSSPNAQPVNISNPGRAALHWTATTNAPWLSLSSQSGDVAAGASAQTRALVNTGNLLPGTYNATIAIQGSGAGSVMHNLQNIPISVTITPGCALTVKPDMLAFTAGYQESAPAPKLVNLSTANCSSPLMWKATAHASWLSLSQTSGSTTNDPTIGINMAGLQPGTYNSSITFSSNSGTQEVPVRFTMSQLAEPALSVGSTDSLNFHGSAGQSSAMTRYITLTNTGSGTLLWSAKALTGGSGGWLTVSPGSGSISAHQSRSLAVTGRTLTGMQSGTYAGAINIAATDAQGHAIAGSPQHIPVSNIVDAPPPPAKPSVQVSNGTLTFSTVAGTSPIPQVITISNTGKAPISWQVSKPSQPWLVVSPLSGSDPAGAFSTITLSADITGLTPGTYEANVMIKPSSGPPIIVTAALTVTKAVPTPVATPNPTPLPTAAPQPAPTPTDVPTPGATAVPTPRARPTPEVTPTSEVVATPSPDPSTPTPTSRGAPPPVNTAVPSPSPRPTPMPTFIPTATPVPAQPTPVPTATSSPAQPTPENSQPVPVHPVHKPVSTVSSMLPTPTAKPGNNYTPPGNIHAAPSPTTPPKLAPTELPIVKATPTPQLQVVPTQEPVLKVTPTSMPEDDPTPTVGATSATPEPEDTPTPSTKHYKKRTYQ